MQYGGQAPNQSGRAQTDLRAPTHSQIAAANTYAHSQNYNGLSANTYGAERGGYGQEDYDRAGLQSGHGSAYGERGGSYNSPSRDGSRGGSPGRRGAAAYGQQGLHGRDAYEYAEDYSLSRDQSAHGKAMCQCGNVYMDDAVFCRKCGNPRNKGEALYAMAPLAVSKELFVNVVVTAIDEDIGKSVSNWVGGLMTTKQHKGEMKAAEIYPVISDHVKRNIYNFGWDSDVSLVMLPPSHGVQRWAPYLQMGVDHLPIYMVFRVQLRSRVRHMGDGGGLAHMFGSCCDMFVPGSAIRREDWDHIGRGVSDSLRRVRNQIRASVEVRDAPGEFHVLHTKGWTEELSSQAIMQSRGGAGHDGYGSPHGSPGMSGMNGVGGMGGMAGVGGMGGMGGVGGMGGMSGMGGMGGMGMSPGGAGYH